MPGSNGGERPSCGWSAAPLASLLLAAGAAVVLRRHGPAHLPARQPAAADLPRPSDDRRLLAAQQASGGSTYRAAFRRVFCNDADSLLFDNLQFGGRTGYRIQAECEEKCNQNDACQFMLWGWNPRGYYRCATFASCSSQVPYREGEPTVFAKASSQDGQQHKEPHAVWVGGAYAESNDPLTMEFCSLSGDCDLFGAVTPLPTDGRAHAGCQRQGGKWCSVRPPLDELFSPVDGGDGRACRRTSEDDNRRDYYHIKKLGTTASIAECQGLCLAHGSCTGIEHIAFRREHRCEIWQERVMATLPLEIATCLRHVNWMNAPNCCLKGSCGACEELGKLGARDQRGCAAEGGQWCEPACRWYGLFAPVDGGVDRACRGAEPWDDDPSYSETHVLGLEESIDRCKHLCLDEPRCRGIEYTEFAAGPRCRLWTRQAGIGSAQHAEGSTCLRWTR